MSFYTIVNGAAGGGRARTLAEPVLRDLGKRGIVGEIVYTERPQHATELARKAYEDGHRRFLAVGGDGTSFEIVNGLFPAAKAGEVTLAMLPLGTGNSFLKDFGIKNAADAIRAIERDRAVPCDVVRAEHDAGSLHYINLLSVGFSARAGAMTNQRFKPFGAAGYVMAVLSCLARLEYDDSKVCLDDGAPDTRPSALLSFSNSRFTAGAMMMAPHADVSDGQVDVIRVGRLGRARFLSTFPRIFRGTHVTARDIEETRAKRVDFVDSALRDVMIDGEILRLRLASLEVMPAALKVIA